MTELQDAHTLAAELKADPELLTALSVRQVIADHAKAAFERQRSFGSLEGYERARLEYEQALAELADIERQITGVAK